MALAMVGALGSVVHDRTMSRRPKGKSTSKQASESAIAGEPIIMAVAETKPRADSKPEAKETKRRRRGTAALEAHIGYRFANAVLLENALTHVSALSGAEVSLKAR